MERFFKYAEKKPLNELKQLAVDIEFVLSATHEFTSDAAERYATMIDRWFEKQAGATLFSETEQQKKAKIIRDAKVKFHNKVFFI